MTGSSKTPELEWLAAAAGGSKPAFEKLVRHFGAGVLALASRRASDRHRAEDLAQEIWIKIFRALPRWRAGSSGRAWIFSIALNHLRDAHRREVAHPLVFLEDFRAEHEQSASPIEELDQRASVQAALGSVTEPYRSALILVDQLGLDYAEAATALACPVGTLRSRVHRGRAQFREQFEAPAAGHARPRTALSKEPRT